MSAPRRTAGIARRSALALVLVLLGSRRRRHHLHLPLRGNRHQTLLRPRVTHRKLASLGSDYKQGIQCWANTSRGSVPQVRNEQNKHSAHCSSQAKFPAFDMQPNTALQSSLRKVPTTAITESRSSKTMVQHHATHNHSTRTAVPIRRIVSSSLKQQDTIHSFQLVFRVQSHNARRCVNSNSNRKTVMKFTNHKTQIASHAARSTRTRSDLPTNDV